MNKTILMGRLTKDPETNATANNTVYARYTLAVDRRFAKEGYQQTDFIPVVSWGKTGEFVSMYFKKGMRVAVIGNLEVNQYTDKASGEPRTFTQVNANEVYFADSKRDSGGDTYGFGNTPTFEPQNTNTNVASEEVDFSDFANSDDFNIETEDDINFVN